MSRGNNNLGIICVQGKNQFARKVKNRTLQGFITGVVEDELGFVGNCIGKKNRFGKLVFWSIQKFKKVTFRFNNTGFRALKKNFNRIISGFNRGIRKSNCSGNFNSLQKPRIICAIFGGILDRADKVNHLRRMKVSIAK